MPLPPSSMTFMGTIASASMYPSASARNGSATSSAVMAPGRSAGGPGSPWITMSRSSPMPESPESASAPRFTSFAPVYLAGLCDAVHMRPPSIWFYRKPRRRK
jgi:hypothetical protein